MNATAFIITITPILLQVVLLFCMSAFEQENALPQWPLFSTIVWLKARFVFHSHIDMAPKLRKGSLRSRNSKQKKICKAKKTASKFVPRLAKAIASTAVVTSRCGNAKMSAEHTLGGAQVVNNLKVAQKAMNTAISGRLGSRPNSDRSRDPIAGFKMTFVDACL